MKALDYLSSLSHRTNEQEEVVNQARSVRVALLLNIAACDLKMSQHSAALENCEKVLLHGISWKHNLDFEICFLLYVCVF